MARPFCLRTDRVRARRDVFQAGGGAPSGAGGSDADARRSRGAAACGSRRPVPGAGRGTDEDFPPDLRANRGGGAAEDGGRFDSRQGTSHGRRGRDHERREDHARTRWNRTCRRWAGLGKRLLRMRTAQEMGRQARRGERLAVRSWASTGRRRQGRSGWERSKGAVMKVCVPVAEFAGLDSKPYGHFGSAPCFAVVDTETMGIESIGNADRGHGHGACSPLRALSGHSVDAVVVEGIGGGALRGLRSMGVAVYHGTGATLSELVAQLKGGRLKPLGDDASCAGHGHGHGCMH